MYLFNKSVGEKPTSATNAETAKTEAVKPVGRALVEEKPTQLYSLKEPSSPIMEQTKPAVASKISKIVSDVGNEALLNFKKSSKDYIVRSRLGKSERTGLFGSQFICLEGFGKNETKEDP